MSTQTVYTIEELNEWSIHYPMVKSYFWEIGPDISAKFGNKFDFQKTPYEQLAKNYIFLVCLRNDVITGHMLCRIFNSPLDPSVKILYQLSFYVKPDSGRTAYHLFQKFIDIGKDRANHIITMLTSQTNIKPSTLENMGFKEIETLYRLEITDELRKR